MQQRRDTEANWTSNNPTLAAGELGLETDTGKIKIGTGSTAWTALAYAATGTVTSVTAGTGLSGGAITDSGTISINTAVTADLTTAQTFTNKTVYNGILTGTLTASGGVGTSQQVLSSTGTGVQWITVSSGTTANDQAFAFAVQVFA
jgi:hypothetical protein